MMQAQTQEHAVSQIKRKPLKIAVLIPFYKFMDAKSVESLIVMIADIHNRGDVYVPIFCHSLLIEKARTLLIKTAVEQAPDADYVLCIDTDHVYSAKALYGLIEALEERNLDMLSAAYVARSMPGFYAHCALDAQGIARKIPSSVREGIVECDAVGFGFLLMRPSFLRKMWEKHAAGLFSAELKDGKMQASDDVRFCELARQEGHGVMFHAGIKVGHISQVVL